MGSSYSLINDTDKDVYVSDGVNKAALFGGILAGLAVATLGAGALAAAAGATTAAAAGGFLAIESGIWVGTMEGVVLTAAQAAGLVMATGETILGLGTVGWTTVASISGLMSAGAALTAGLTAAEKDKIIKMKEELKKLMEGYAQLKPGSNEA